MSAWNCLELSISSSLNGSLTIKINAQKILKEAPNFPNLIITFIYWLEKLHPFDNGNGLNHDLKTHGLNELDFIKNCIRFRSHILIWSEFIAVYLLYIALRLLLDNIIKWIKKILSPLEKKKQQFYTPLLSNIPYLSVSKWYFWLASFIITPRVHVALSFHFYLCKFPSNNYHKNYLHLKIM